MAGKDFNFDLNGVDEIYKMLEELDPLLKASVLQDVNFETASKTVLPVVKSAAPVGDDKLYNDIKVRRNKDNHTSVFVGNTSDTFWARFYEFGTVVRSLLGKGKYKAGTNRGKIEPKPFFEKSYDKTIPNAISFFNDKFGNMVVKALKKRNRRTINKINKVKK